MEHVDFSALRLFLREYAQEIAKKLATMPPGRETEMIFQHPWEITVQVSHIATWPTLPPLDSMPEVKEMLAPFTEKKAEPKLTSLDKKILRVAPRDEPKKAEWFAAAISPNRECSSYFRERLAYLVRVGKLKKSRDGWGYMLA